MCNCAVFTIVRDEPVFLALWHRHYSRHFPSSHMHVLHHVASEDERADGQFGEALSLFDHINVTRLVNADFDPQWLGEVVATKARSLLGLYGAVLFSEADELVLPLPSRCGGSLSAFVEEFCQDSTKSAVRTVGYEVHHAMPAEPAIDRAVPIMTQRHHWHRNPLYDKALLMRSVPTWSLGFHTCTEFVPQDESLILVHLHKYDFQAFVARHEERAAYKHAESAVANGWNAHYRTRGAAIVAQYMASVCSPLECIPEWVVGALADI